MQNNPATGSVIQQVYMAGVLLSGLLDQQVLVQTQTCSPVCTTHLSEGCIVLFVPTHPGKFDTPPIFSMSYMQWFLALLTLILLSLWFSVRLRVEVTKRKTSMDQAQNLSTCETNVWPLI